MAAAMARGWAAGDGGPEAMLFADAGSGRAERLASELGGEARATVAELAADCDLVVLAVKPGSLGSAGRGLGDAPAVMSILGATPLARLREVFPESPLIRALPNVAVEVRRGVVCYAPPSKTPQALAEAATGLLARLGLAVEVEERLLDVAMAVMSCSPAYVALIAEALADAGVREGLDARLAQRLVTETLAGTAELLRDRDTLSVRRAVASPGGSTAAGLAALERGAARAAFADAVRASLERMRG